jgi:hypothetical protein
LFDGFLNEYDTAVGIRKHGEHLYVVSNIITEDRRGFEVWCLDTLTGNLVWKKTQYDTLIDYEAVGFDTLPEGGVAIAAWMTDGEAEEELQLYNVRTCQMYLDIYNNLMGEEEGMPFIETSSLEELKVFEPIAVKIIPNPNKGSFAVQLGNTSDNSIFELYNLQGMLMYKKEVKQGINQIDLAGTLGNGMYFGKVTDVKTLYRKTVRIMID